jgi:protein-tyrosine phosphatase
MQAYFGLDIEPIQERSAEVGVTHLRLPINDFDPYHLRQRLPEVVRDMVKAHRKAGGVAYVHCTAGALPQDARRVCQSLPS